MIRILLALLLWASFADASQVVLLLSATDVTGLDVANPLYLLVSGNGHAGATEADQIQYLPPGTVTNLHCGVVAPRTGNLTFTFRVGAADTSLTCTIPAGGVRCYDDTNTATIGADPRVSLGLSLSAGSFTQLTCYSYFTRT